MVLFWVLVYWVKIYSRVRFHFKYRVKIMQYFRPKSVNNEGCMQNCLRLVKASWITHHNFLRIWLSVPWCFRKDKATKDTSKRLRSDLHRVKSHSSSNWMVSRRWRPKLARIICIFEEHSKQTASSQRISLKKSHQHSSRRGRRGEVIRKKKHKPVDWLTELLKLLR